jgi:hypothetical protein
MWLPFNLLVVKRVYRKNLEKSTDSCLQSKYGISLEDYQEIYEAQHGRCAICDTMILDKKQKRLSIDHRHLDGLVRGLLCGRCNRGLGLFRDIPELLEKAARYVRSYSVDLRKDFPIGKRGIPSDVSS